MPGKKESTKPVNGRSTTNSTVRTGKSSGGRSSGSGGGSGGGASGTLQTVVKWLSFAIAIVEIVAIICYIAMAREEVRPYFIYVFFIFGSLMVILSMVGVTGAFIGPRFGFAGDCCWPVGLYLMWQAGALFNDDYSGCKGNHDALGHYNGCNARQAGAIINTIAFAASCVDFVLGLVARFI